MQRAMPFIAIFVAMLVTTALAVIAVRGRAALSDHALAPELEVEPEVEAVPEEKP